MGSVLGFGRSPGGGHGNLLQYSCLESPIDRGAWQATVHRVEKSWTRLKQLSMQITESGYHTPETNTALSIKYKVKLKKNRILLQAQKMSFYVTLSIFHFKICFIMARIYNFPDFFFTFNLVLWVIVVNLQKFHPTTLLNSLILPIFVILSWNGRHNDDMILLNKSVLNPTYNGCFHCFIFHSSLFGICSQIPWKRKWLPTLVFLPGEFHGQRSLAGYSPWGHKESDTTE